MTVADLIAQLELCEPDFTVRVREPRDERDSDGTFTVAAIVPGEDDPVVYLTA